MYHAVESKVWVPEATVLLEQNQRLGDTFHGIILSTEAPMLRLRVIWK